MLNDWHQVNIAAAAQQSAASVGRCGASGSYTALVQLILASKLGAVLVCYQFNTAVQLIQSSSTAAASDIEW